MKKILFILVLFLCIGCKTQQPIIMYRDSISVEYILDSIYIYEKDSIYIEKELIKDTIYITKDKWHIRYKDKLVEKSDTIFVNNEVIVKEIEKITPKWLLWLLGVTGTITLCVCVKYIVKLISKLK